MEASVRTAMSIIMTFVTLEQNHGMLRSFIEETEEVMGMSSSVALTSEFGDITSEELVNA
jgi:hypothetical protein